MDMRIGVKACLFLPALFFFCLMEATKVTKNRATQKTQPAVPDSLHVPEIVRHHLAAGGVEPSAAAQHLRSNKERDKTLATVQTMRVHHRHNQQNMVDFLMSCLLRTRLGCRK